MYTNFGYVYSSLLFVYLFYFVLTVLAKSVTGFLKPPQLQWEEAKEKHIKARERKAERPRAQQSASKSAESKTKKKEIKKETKKKNKQKSKTDEWFVS